MTEVAPVCVPPLGLGHSSFLRHSGFGLRAWKVRTMIILAGDIGGTKTNLGIFEQAAPGGELRKLDEATVPTNSAGSPEELMTQFVKRSPAAAADRVDAAAFGIA